jgi:hypothetical protein
VRAFVRAKLAGASHQRSRCGGAAYINYGPTPTPATRHVRTLTPNHQPRTAPKQAAHKLVPHDSDLRGEVHARSTRKVALDVFPLVGSTCIIPPQHSLPQACHGSSSCGLRYVRCRHISRVVLTRCCELRSTRTRHMPVCAPPCSSSCVNALHTNTDSPRRDTPRISTRAARRHTATPSCASQAVHIRVCARPHVNALLPLELHTLPLQSGQYIVLVDPSS